MAGWVRAGAAATSAAALRVCRGRHYHHGRGRQGHHQTFATPLGLALALVLVRAGNLGSSHMRERSASSSGGAAPKEEGLYIFGCNEGGTIPNCRVSNVSEPVRVAFFDDKGVRSIDFAEKYAAAVDGAGVRVRTFYARAIDR